MIGEGIQSTNQRRHRSSTIARSRLLHRPDCLHRLQGLRGRLQGMERSARRRFRLVWKFLRQHRPSRRLDLAPCSLRRAESFERRPNRRSDVVRQRRRGSIPLDLSLRRLQTLREGRLPRSLSHRLDRPDRSRLRPRAERRLQWVRLLRRRLSLRRDRSPARTTSRAGGAFKCTFCYDRQKSGLTPACAKVCPTESIVFGRLDDLRGRAAKRVQALQESGYGDAQLYDPMETSVGGIHAFFLILGEPEAYGLPPKPQIPTIYLKSSWFAALATAIGAIAAVGLVFAFS